MLSIVIPTLNEEKYLPILLATIKKQVGVDYEIIIADNLSKDDTRKIAVSYGALVVDGGLPAKARNNGAAAAKGSIILFLDADVVLPSPVFLKKTLEEFDERGLSLATCVVCPISERKIDKILHKAANIYIEAFHNISPRLPGFCIFVRKEIHEKISGFDETIKLAEDHEYAQRAVKFAKFGILKSYPIVVSVRRFNRDGRLNIAVKYVLCEAYMELKGPIRSDLFKYRFGYGDADKK
ncbi:MAG: glycosyltransferase [Candidatus Paceibacterota bacterium]|jgi:glycosyltransferase involved in cell wall biosynthesis